MDVGTYPAKARQPRAAVRASSRIDPEERARAIVLATTYFDNPKIVVEAQKMVDEKKSMLGLDTKNLELKMQERGPSS